jgi:hypothetical protein
LETKRKSAILERFKLIKEGFAEKFEIKIKDV